jgi:hypothetical protein
VNAEGKTNLPSDKASIRVAQVIEPLLHLYQIAVVRCNTEQKKGGYFGKIIVHIECSKPPSAAELRTAKALYRRILFSISQRG